MTSFDYDNLPDSMETVDVLPKEMFGDALEILREATLAGDVLAQEVKIAHAYDRKGYMELDSFGGIRNPAYSGNDDDLILQLTIRVSYDARTPLEALAGLEKQVRDRRLEEQRKQLLAEIAQAEAVAAKAKTEAQVKRERLEALR